MSTEHLKTHGSSALDFFGNIIYLVGLLLFLLLFIAICMAINDVCQTIYKTNETVERIEQSLKTKNGSR